MLCCSFLYVNFMYSQETSVSISGPTSVEVGIPYNFTFTFNPQYPNNTSTTAKADSFVITEWIVSTGTNGSAQNIPGYINTPNNNFYYYYDGTYNNVNPKTVPIQWGNGTFSSNDNVTVKVSGFYKINSTGENCGSFNFITKTQPVTVQRLVAPIIEGNTTIANCNQTNQTYTYSNATNSNSRLWTVTGGASIVGSATAGSVTVTPPLVGNYEVYCAVKRANGNPNYVEYGLKKVTRAPFSGSATINGASTFCSSSSFSLNNILANQTVSWSLSDPTFAAISLPSNLTTTITRIKQGDVTLKAKITNACGEFYEITKDITIGINGIVAKLTSPTGLPYSYPYYNVPNDCSNPMYVFITSSPNTNLNSTTKKMRFTYNGISITKDPVANYYFFLYASDFNISPGNTFNVKAEVGNDCGFPPKSMFFQLYRPTLCQCGIGNGCLQLTKMSNATAKLELENITEEKMIKIYPNPAKDFITIEIKGENDNSILESKSSAKLYDALDHLVLETEIKSSNTNLNTTGFAKGIYILNISKNCIEETHKIIIE
jgi:Secretion system C-terminal sorting domain